MSIETGSTGVEVGAEFLANRTDLQYHGLLYRILTEGEEKGDRTGTGTRSVFGHKMEFDLAGGNFPLITTKKVHFKSVAHELLWFLQGATNIRYLKENGVSIWDEWADENGELGPVYGKQWRRWLTADGREIDQIGKLAEDIKNNPNSRRHIMSAWNVGDLDRMALAPCHMMAQFDVTAGKLSCLMYQRSADAFLGVPFNIASYALLTRMMAQVTETQPGRLIIVTGDTHLYRNHLEQAAEQLNRLPFTGPQLELNPQVTDINDFVYGDLKLINYRCHPPIKAEISV